MNKFLIFFVVVLEGFLLLLFCIFCFFKKIIEFGNKGLWYIILLFDKYCVKGLNLEEIGFLKVVKFGRDWCCWMIMFVFNFLMLFVCKKV